MTLKEWADKVLRDAAEQGDHNTRTREDVIRQLMVRTRNAGESVGRHSIVLVLSGGKLSRVTKADALSRATAGQVTRGDLLPPEGVGR